MKALVLFITLFSPAALIAQGKSVNLGGMEMSYRLRADSIYITLSAPTTGWIGIGFNSQNSIVKSDLILFHIIDNQTEAVDMYVVAAGNPQKDDNLGGQQSITVKHSLEAEGKTTVRFSVALRSRDRYDYQHNPGDDFWLILAYSTHDEFEHHSRMRKHIKYRFSDD
ncbi:MAG: DOMON domain-containing protein [Bacteroidota bacterium]